MTIEEYRAQMRKVYRDHVSALNYPDLDPFATNAAAILTGAEAIMDAVLKVKDAVKEVHDKLEELREIHYRIQQRGY